MSEFKFDDLVARSVGSITNDKPLTSSGGTTSRDWVSWTPSEEELEYISSPIWNRAVISKMPKEVRNYAISSILSNPIKKATTVIFKNGDVSIAKCKKEDEYSLEYGVAIAFLKYHCGSGNKMRKLFKEAKVITTKPKKVEAPSTINLGEVEKHILDSDKIEVGDTVEIISRYGGYGDSGEVVGFGNGVIKVRNDISIDNYKDSGDGRDYWLLGEKYLKLIKKAKEVKENGTK